MFDSSQYSKCLELWITEYPNLEDVYTEWMSSYIKWIYTFVLIVEKIILKIVTVMNI